jgi:hypothetical protein
LLGQVFVCPHHGAKTGAVGEAQLREIQHEDLQAVVIQHCADSPAQTVLVSCVKLALEPQH